MTDSTQLSLLTEDELTRLEKKVREGLKSFVEVGNALLKIQQNRGYIIRGYKTFETYCLKEFGFTDRHGRRMITAAQTAGNVQKAIGQAPANESVARQLQAIAKDPIVLQKVKDKLEKKHTDITKASAEVVAEAVATVTGKARPEPKVNGNGDKPLRVTSKAVKEMGMADEKAPARDELLLGYVRAANLFLTARPPNVAAAQAELDNCVRLLTTKSADASKAKTCKNCGEPLQAGVSLCFSCGEVVK